METTTNMIETRRNRNRPISQGACDWVDVALRGESWSQESLEGETKSVDLRRRRQRKRRRGQAWRHDENEST